jgi:hypothetical protein
MENSMEIKEKRSEERYHYKIPEFVYAEFRVGKGPEKDRVYDLKVMNFSRYGLTMVITQKDFDLLHILNEGDTLSKMSFFTKSDVVKLDGIVRHITEIKEGKYKGCYYLGIESPDIIKSYEPKDC